MSFLRIIFTLGFIYITFDLLWSILLFILKAIFGFDRHRSSVGSYLFKGIAYFLLATLTGTVVSNYMGGTENVITERIFIVIGFAVLYFYITSKLHNNRLKASIKKDVRALRQMRFDSLFLFPALLLYSACLFYPSLLQNKMTEWFFSAIGEIYDLWVFRMIIGFFAIIFLINIIIKSLRATRTLVFSILTWLGIKVLPPSGAAAYREESETLDAEYEEVTDDEGDTY